MVAMSPRRGRRPVWRRTAAPLVALLIATVAVAAGTRPLPTMPRTGAWGVVDPTPLADAAPPDADGFVDPTPTPTPTQPPQLAAHPVTVTPGPQGAHLLLPILLYHYIRFNPVATDQVGFELSVTPPNFAQQMAFLRFVGAHTVTLAAAMQALQTGQPLPPRSVILTFDDGYMNFATKATPVLVANGQVATVFVVSGFINRNGYMTADQVKQVDRLGMVVGAHTVNHVDLSHMPAAIAKEQIDVSHAALDALLGHDVLDFAYPYGGFNAGVEQLVQQSGFRDAVTTQGGDELSPAHPYAWPRFHVGGSDTLLSFAHSALYGEPVAEINALVGRFLAVS
jgi:peptidoglycan/xylan/chitin deacetylase (PgdA/CDA1 family)